MRSVLKKFMQRGDVYALKSRRFAYFPIQWVVVLMLVAGGEDSIVCPAMRALTLQNADDPIKCLPMIFLGPQRRVISYYYWHNTLSFFLLRG